MSLAVTLWMTGWLAGGVGFSGRGVSVEVPFVGGGLVEVGLMMFGLVEFEARERSP